MNALAAKALEIVNRNNAARKLANNNANSITTTTAPAVVKPRQNINYRDLAHYIRVMDLKGVVDVFGDVCDDKYAAHKLAEYCIARWDMTPDVFEYIEQYLLSPLRYPIILDKPTHNHVYAEDFDNEYQFKRYCELIELKIKTKPGYIMKAPYIDAPLKISGINAFMYANRYANAKFAAPLKMNTSADVFDRISYYFHTHNLDIGRQFAAYKFDARSIKYLENHFEICNEGEACSINKVVRVITNSNPDFVVSVGLRTQFQMVTGRVNAPKDANDTTLNPAVTITNVPVEQQPRKRRGKKSHQYVKAEIA
ncbi:hypothetical protein F-M6_0310 [Faustovirus]|nr:hypothetical protein F-M6_0310 [Faustovirus]